MSNDNLEKAILQIQKAIRDNNVSNKQLYYIIQLLNRQYIDITVRDNIIKYMDNIAICDNNIEATNSNEAFINALPTADEDT